MEGSERVREWAAVLAQKASSALAEKAMASLSVVSEALREYDGAVSLCFNGGKDCTVLLHMLSILLTPAALNRIPIVHFRPPDEASVFPQVLAFIDRCERDYSLAPTHDVRCHTIREGLSAVLAARPTTRAMLLGVRATDPGCAALRSFHPTDPGWPRVVRVSPILGWRYADVWDYLRALHVPVCPLYDAGFTSLGAVDSTRPNPLLCQPDGSFLPAWRLQDETAERMGRVRPSPPPTTPPLSSSNADSQLRTRASSSS